MITHTYASYPQTKMEIDPKLEFRLTDHQKSVYEMPQYKDIIKFKTAEEERDWARMQTHKCKDCKEVLPMSYFNGNTSGRDHFDKNGYRLRRPECRKCTSSNNRGKDKAKTAAKKNGMEQKAPEGTACELCKKTDNIVFDHDHVTSIFRGWLCDPCNRSMGVLGDNVVGLLKVVNYMNKHEKKKPVIDEDTGEISVVS